MNLKKARIICCFFIVTIGPLCILAYFVAKHWDKVEPDFYRVSLSDVVQIVITMLVAIFITYLIKVRTDYDLKRFEILSMVIDELRQRLDHIVDLSSQYIANKNKEYESVLQREMKAASKMVNVLLRLRCESGLRGDKGFEDICKKNFFAFKKAVTDSPFGMRRKYTDAEMSNIHSRHIEIIHTLYQYKLSLYK